MSKAHKSLLVVSISALLAGAAFFALRPAPAKAQKKAGHPASSRRDDGLDNYDIRTDKTAAERIASFRNRLGKGADAVSALRDRQSSGIRSLRGKVSSLKVDYSETLQTPEIIGPDVRGRKAFLTKPTAGRRAQNRRRLHGP